MRREPTLEAAVAAVSLLACPLLASQSNSSCSPPPRPKPLTSNLLLGLGVLSWPGSIQVKREGKSHWSRGCEWPTQGMHRCANPPPPLDIHLRRPHSWTSLAHVEKLPLWEVGESISSLPKVGAASKAGLRCTLLYLHLIKHLHL